MASSVFLGYRYLASDGNEYDVNVGGRWNDVEAWEVGHFPSPRVVGYNMNSYNSSNAAIAKELMRIWALEGIGAVAKKLDSMGVLKQTKHKHVEEDEEA